MIPLSIMEPFGLTPICGQAVTLATGLTKINFGPF
jgi:hypothetical protein